MNFKLPTIFKSSLVFTGALATVMVSCNKELPVAEPIQQPVPAGQSIVSLVNNTAEYSILKAAIARAGSNLTATLSDSSGVFTFFAPNDAAFQQLGITSPAAVAVFSPGFLDTVLRYHFIPGQKLDSAQISIAFPNVQEPTGLVLATPSATLPPGLRMSIFPSKRGTSLWANNVPVTQANIPVSNGIVHKVAAIVIPPSTTIKGIIASDPTNFSILSAAIARADSGQTGLNKFDSVFNYVPASITLFAPTNTAFRAMFPPGTPDAVIIGTLNTPAYFTATQVRGLIAYHILGSRAFSVNFTGASNTPYNTKLTIPPTNTVVPVIISYGGTTFTVKGLANTTPSNVTTRDKNAINGVIHIIDQVLRPS